MVQTDMVINIKAEGEVMDTLKNAVSYLESMDKKMDELIDEKVKGLGLRMDAIDAKLDALTVMMELHTGVRKSYNEPMVEALKEGYLNEKRVIFDTNASK